MATGSAVKTASESSEEGDEDEPWPGRIAAGETARAGQGTTAGLTGAVEVRKRVWEGERNYGGDRPPGRDAGTPSARVKSSAPRLLRQWVWKGSCCNYISTGEG